MYRQKKDSFSLPKPRLNFNSYVERSISMAKKGCYNSNKQLKIDDGFGDYCMNLFRLKHKRKFVRDIPTAFSPEIRQLLRQKPQNPKLDRIATDHNRQIDKILSTPKQIYLQKIRLQKYALEQRLLEEKRRNEYIKGYDEQVREYNEHLSFEYLSEHQSNNWFKIKDYSSLQEAPVYLTPVKETFSTPRPKVKQRKGFIFASDRQRKTNYFNKI